MEGLFIGKDNKYIDQVRGTSILSLLAKLDNLEIMLYEFSAGRPNSIIPGDSSDLMEFYYIIEGSIVIDVGDDRFELGKGEYFYVHNIKATVPFRTTTDTKMLYVTSAPVYNYLYTYTDDLNNLLIKSEKKDAYTHNHGNRVQDYSVKIAAKLGLTNEINYTIALASLFHDIGKCFIPDEILNKPSSLNEVEFSYIKKHSEYSADLLRGKFVEDVEKIVLQHHERLDGSGYPKGLKGDEICIEAKIIAVADSYDAMTSDRSYRTGLTPEVAIEELKDFIGKYYDESIVLAFEKVLHDDGIL
ncbi:HD-GYP domain-containing protein (c-di-GMP phosphodiesterase class II) [Sedimentibacter acidaminivorans]|uniref:HD-GYP domain-containing protein (C-di-GMP phosphodiesterase class II) n=1 Tax=Sedimentibacter acidaminivorans TaxID=913099 RepID=A0ABS4G985_9FIRM|nr:HD domain-containing phosphohydrolase [Sedimentibacter acidaminivorans]MBP1924241.1 HD-GYP domain-containing protein (c-di-GMP phosphodiesterase class II) [Sedimentibacter acidaminivorans]